MGTEIERKFLVVDPSVVDGLTGTVIREGYLSRVPERTVRIRRTGDRGVITIKGASSGASRSEWEYEIPAGDADAMLEICEGAVVDKIRYLIDVAGRTWEVDVFAGANAGLVMAEVELDREDAVVVLPDWAGLEVTDDPRYYNASLSRHPMPGDATR
jgi:CYTH domain-containing protein